MYPLQWQLFQKHNWTTSELPIRLLRTLRSSTEAVINTASRHWVTNDLFQSSGLAFMTVNKTRRNLIIWKGNEMRNMNLLAFRSLDPVPWVRAQAQIRVLTSLKFSGIHWTSHTYFLYFLIFQFPLTSIENIMIFDESSIRAWNCDRRVDVSSAAGGRTVWPCPGAAGHVREPAFTDSPTWNAHPLIADGLEWASSYALLRVSSWRWCSSSVHDYSFSFSSSAVTSKRTKFQSPSNSFLDIEKEWEPNSLQIVCSCMSVIFYILVYLVSKTSPCTPSLCTWICFNMFYESLLLSFSIMSSLLPARCIVEGGWELAKLFVQPFLPAT